MVFTTVTKCTHESVVVTKTDKGEDVHYCTDCGNTLPDASAVSVPEDFWNKLTPENKACLEKWREGEPMFILLGRDPDAFNILRMWAYRRLLAGGDEIHCDSVIVLSDEFKEYSELLENKPNSAPDIKSYPPVNTTLSSLIKLSKEGWFVDDEIDDHDEVLQIVQDLLAAKFFLGDRMVEIPVTQQVKIAKTLVAQYKVREEFEDILEDMADVYHTKQRDIIKKVEELKTAFVDTEKKLQETQNLLEEAMKFIRHTAGSSTSSQAVNDFIEKYNNFTKR